jgi:hypothetical protein
LAKWTTLVDHVRLDTTFAKCVTTRRQNIRASC